MVSKRKEKAKSGLVLRIMGVVLTSVALFSVMMDGESQARVVKDIAVKGNKRIEQTTVLSYIPIKAGVDYSQEDIDQALKSLYNTGYFADVQIHEEGGSLIIEVMENAIINKIAFEGNSKLKDDKLKEEVQLRPREVLSRTKIQSAQQRILDIYRRMGRYGATVEPKVIKQSDNRVDLVFEINEGDVTHVRKINFVGNKHISASHLEKALLTKKSQWFRFFASDDTYDPDRFVGDQHFLRQYYLDNGYADFHLISAVAELTPDQKDLFLTFTLEEGERYRFGKFEIVSEMTNLKPEQFAPCVMYGEGDWFSAKLLEKTVTAITERAGVSGFAFANVDPVIEKNVDSKTVDVKFVIKEGPRVYVERIEFRGNDRTRDEVLRREIRIHEGDAYNTIYVKRAEQNLNDLGYFKKVELITEQGSAPDKVIIIAKVEEQSTGEFGVAVGFSTLDKALGSLSFSERNFMGTGRTVHSNLSIAMKRQEFDIGISDPYFLGYNLVAGADAFHTRSTRISTFEEKSTGGRVNVGYKLAEHWYQNWTYNFQRDQISDVPNHASVYIKQQRGTFYNSGVIHAITYDRTDSRRSPTSGYNIEMTNNYVGIGGDIGYLRNTIGGAWYYSPLDEVVMNLRGSVGLMTKTNRTIRVADSVMLGADNFRGFAYGGVGPRDKKTKDALGGTRFWLTTFETVFPIGLPNEFGVKGAAFVECGNVWRAGVKKVPGNPIRDVNKPRLSVGAGVSWDSPFGPLRIDYGIPVKKYKGDREQRIYFGVSHRF